MNALFEPLSDEEIELLDQFLLDRIEEDAEVEQLQDSITPNVRAIHAWWLARRENQAPSLEPQRRPEPRVGRNDPCPCGSGKKYKKCCLH